jgi:putative FmdB family regulatory protein
VPTYQYACTECGHDFEQFQSFTDDALTTCPVCEGRLRKVFNAVGVVFKGSGFYRNDSRTGSGSDEKPAAAAVDGGSKGGEGEGAAATTGDATKSESGTPAKAGASSGKDGSTSKAPSTSSTKKDSPSAA